MWGWRMQLSKNQMNQPQMLDGNPLLEEELCKLRAENQRLRGELASASKLQELAAGELFNLQQKLKEFAVQTYEKHEYEGKTHAR
jgi:hypothetical protein